MTDIITAQKIVAIAKDDGIGGGKNIVAGASVNITFVGGGIAPIFADNLGTTPISLPNVTDADGEFAFFIKSGEYFYVVAGESHRVTVGIGGLPITLSDSGNMTISNTGTVVIQSAATSIKNVMTIDAPGNTAIVDLKGGGSGSNANGFMRIYSGDGTLASYVGHQGGVDFNAECQEGFSILSSQKTGAKGLIAAGNEGAIVTPNGGGTKAVFTLTAATGATDKATFEYDFTSTPVLSLKRLGTAYLTVSADSLTQWTGAGTIAAQYTPTNTTIFRNGQPRLAASATETILYSPSTIPVVTATTTTTTINAGNGTQSIDIDSGGRVGIKGLADSLFVHSVWGQYPILYKSSDFVSGSVGTAFSVRFASPSGDTDTILQAVKGGGAGGGSALILNGYGGEVVVGGFTPQGYAMSVVGGILASNFYGNGYSLTQLNASNVVNGTLPSNIFPATISAASITFSGNHIAKGGTAYNLLDITSTASILRDSAGNVALAATTTDVQLKRANNILLNATATATQLFNHAGSIRANFTATDSQIFAPSGAPFLSATTTTAAITSGNGAACLSIDSTGAGLMRFPVYTVATVPSAAANADRVIIVSNASLGRGLYTSDATNWRSAQSGTILS